MLTRWILTLWAIFKTGSIQHQLVTGFDVFKQIDAMTDGVISSQALIDLFNPVYGRPMGPVTGRNQFVIYVSSFRHLHSRSDYLCRQPETAPRWTI